MTLASDDDKWRIVLGGNNLTDELYPVAGTSSLTTASGYAEIIYARPPTVSLERHAKFLTGSSPCGQKRLAAVMYIGLAITAAMADFAET